MHKTVLVWIAVAGVALAAGCSSHKARPNTSGNTPVPAEQSQTSGADNANALGAGGAGAAAADGDAARAAALQLQNRVIYFDFDSSDIKPDYNALITTHARHLTSNPTIRIRLEGNTDERGSREYNIGLGERRAQSVRRALMLQGVAESQITTVSYGEERPAVTGHTEAAWSRNRRVELLYLN
jgi:peptidoglycan-associated lipoprotein